MINESVSYWIMTLIECASIIVINSEPTGTIDYVSVDVLLKYYQGECTYNALAVTQACLLIVTLVHI